MNMINLSEIKKMVTYAFAKIRGWLRISRERCDSQLLSFADSIGYRKWRRNPLGYLRASKSHYDDRFHQANNTQNPIIDELENNLGYKIPVDFLEEVAYQVQISFKKSFPDFSHGRVLYSALSDYLKKHTGDRQNKGGGYTIYETGTAKGFSSLCMAKALSDFNAGGKILTFDIIPHEVDMFWNCVNDHLRGPVSRKTLLDKWKELIDCYIFFIEGDSRLMLNKVHVGRVNFAFLDGGHTYKDVCFEFENICPKQHAGDVVIFDDYNKIEFPEIVQAVNEMTQKHGYSKEIIPLNGNRRLAICRKS